MAHRMAAAAMAVAVVLTALAPWPVAPTSPGPHITDLNVLLPPRMTHSVEYRLQGSGGCFAWSWDHHDVLRVQPEYNVSSRCSTSARLISISRYSGRKETAVYATDLHSDITIRCKVIIDTISRIQIFHHAVKIDLDELSTLRIRAFDSEENVFSSLVGLQFLWKLFPKSLESDSINHLVHIPLKETPLSDCGDLDLQIELEDRGVGSDLYVVKGVAIGHEVVSAQLLEPQLEHVMDQIILTVAEAMSLDPPSPVFVTVGALLCYSLRVIHLKTAKVVDLPSPHHRWYVTNSSVAHVDIMMGVVHALNLGITDIIVEDTRVSGHAQTSTMHIVIPDKLCLYIVPVTNDSTPLEGMAPISSSDVWYVFPGQEYIVHIKVFSKGPDANEILVTENNGLRLESNTSKYWDLYSVSKDVTSIYNRENSRLLIPISQGKGTLTAALTYQRENLEMVEVLSIVQEVNVCSKVKLILEEEHDYNFGTIHLPWAPGIDQEFKIKATGGCGKYLQDYKWFSSNEAVVSASGFGSLQAKRPGHVIIKVISVFDSANFDEVAVEVSVPAAMVILPIFPVEVVIGTQLHAAVTLRTSNGNYYSRCDAFSTSIRWKVSSESGSFKFMNTTDLLSTDIFRHVDDSKPQYGFPCAWTSLFAFGVGRAVLHASLSIESVPYFQSLDQIITLKAVSSIAAYYPLIAYQAGNGDQFGGYWVDLSKTDATFQDLDGKGLDELYLVPGSMMDVLLLGGPERWDQKVEFIETVGVLGEQNLSVVQLHETSSGRRLYKVVCQTFGKFKLLFSRGNLVGDDHPKPAIANLELTVLCGFPSSIVMIVNEPASKLDVIEAAINADRNPARLRVSPISVSNGCTIRISAVSIHATGRAFANSSSLCLRWELSGCEELAFWNDTNSVAQFDGAKWERFLVLKNASGLCIVHVTVIGFSEEFNSHRYEEASSLLEVAALTDAMPLQLVASLRVLPEFALIAFYPEAEVNLSITGGTCFLDAYINDTQVAGIVQPPESTECSHFTVGARGLGMALVIVRDSGLSPPASASALVKVASVDWIKIISQEEISLMEGTTKSFDILAGTEDGSIFDSSQYMYMKIKVHLEDGILEPVDEYHSSRTGNWLVREPNFSVRAAKLGIATLFVSVSQQSGYEIVSQFVKVEVYGPLRLHPEYLYLLPGVSYLLTVKDGPRIGAFVEFTSLHEEIVVVQKPSGKLFAKSIGNATVRAAVYGNGDSLICEAYAKIEVGIPPAMGLNLQSDQLCVGCKMPVFPSFPEGDLFSFYEVCQEYKWTIGNEKVLSFRIDSCEQDGYPCHSVDSDGAFINVLTGRSAGRSEVSIFMSCDVVLSGSPQQLSYTASKSLEVVPSPPLALGIPITWILPPFYMTSEILPRLSDSYGQLDSRKSITYSILRVCGRNDVLKQEGMTIDGGKIRTKQSKENICIQANDHATGRAEIACCIKVAEVSQVWVTTTEALLHVAYLAVNSKLELDIGYSDYLGYPFAEAHGVVPLEVETNHPDVLSIFMSSKDNNSTHGNEHVLIEAKKPGNALVRISINRNPRNADFILVSVGAQLYPRNPVLHVGQYLNFTVVGDGIDGLQSGKWLSGNGSVLLVNRITGEGYARGEGATQVIFVGSNLKLQTTVAVMKVGQLSVYAPAKTLTNIPFPTKGYMFCVKFSEPVDYKLEATGNNEAPFDCRVDPPFVGYSKPYINNVTGYSYCLFFPYSPKHLLSVMSKSSIRQQGNANSEGLVSVSIIASLKETPNVIGSAHAAFVGGFVLDTEKLNLTPKVNKSIIAIMGNTDVEISWNAKDLLSVNPLNIVSFGMVGIIEYEVKVLRSQKFKDKIAIVLPATGQRTEIDVTYEPGEGTSASGVSNITWTAVLICAAVLMVTVGVFMRLLERPDRSLLSRQAGPTSSAVAGPVTTDSISTGNFQSSPRTPQPFMEYVRRTIDETPYYNREGRRRFDPRYTY
ncbi:nuclear pore complex protein GP210-like isoform X1 [Musa acuminata AAA Group]|uniref:nuclear pore complex protein GP210-like isoform X1 n=1 Tax=Musa acuminata AAA Group TaxID=214697 RepID=UPI0031D0291B